MSTDDQELDLRGLAVIGLAGRFPGARTCDEFWDNLRNGRETLTFFTEEELLAAGLKPGDMVEKRVRSRGTLPGADLFDPAFFGYSPKEAEIMDPQQRVFLETAWEALESAGYDPDRVPGPVGVFAGAGINTYYPYNILTRPDVIGPFGVFPAVLLNEKDFIATRVAYKLNLRGPAVNIQTACSTSLVAIASACQSLLNFDCDIALAGGVAGNFPQCHSRIHEEGGMISGDGHCRPFDAKASGTLFSDGVGVVALRRLEDAVAAGDHILAVVKGFALNNDGSDKAGFTAPSVRGQARAIQMAHVLGDIEPETITYVEAHGTATPLGDPVEIAGLTQAFRAGTDARQFCAIGSVKSNIGHLDVAAGVAGFIKTVLALHHREIPPTINYSKPNPHIDFASSPFYVADKLIDWQPPKGVPRRAGVSSFGVGGTNAHAVLEEAPALAASSASRAWQMIPLSARTPAALDAMTARLAAHVAANPQQSFADLAYTLKVGRRQFNHRRVAVARDGADLVARLQKKGLSSQGPLRRNPPVVFMFPGQGSQRVNMGRELYETEPLYREIVDQCAVILKQEIGADLRTILYPAPGKEAEAEKLIVQTRITQPALFVTEYALAKLWMSWGVQPAAMIGHSVGEYVAACLSGVFTLADGLKLIATRGRLIQEQPAGCMLAVMCPVAEVKPLLPAGVDIAAINAPTLCVASGPQAGIEELERALTAKNLTSRRLLTSHAFHSEMMQPVVATFDAVLRKVAFGTPEIPYVSNVTGTWITADQPGSPDYWTRHLRGAVHFSDGMNLLMGRGEQVFLEVGPGAALTSLATQHVGKSNNLVAPSLAGDRDQTSELAHLLGALGRLWQAGVEIDWAGFHAQEKRRRVPLPTYPFEHKRYFVEPGEAVHAAGAAAPTPAAAPTVVAPAPQAAVPAPATAASREEKIGARVVEIMHSLSGIEPEALDADATFLQMGFDSLFMSQLSRALEGEFAVPVTFRELTSSLPNITALTRHFAANSPKNFDAAPVAAAAPVAPTVAARGTVPATAAAPVASVDLSAIMAQLAQLSRQVERLTAAMQPPRDLTLPMSEAQQEIWLASQLGEDASRTYNESYLLKFQGALDVTRLREAVQELVNRRDSLRAVFAPDGSGQTIRARLDVELPLLDVSEAQLATQIREHVDRLFDLAAGPMFRARLFRTGTESHTLLLVVHHIVADGWSWGLMIEELGALYSALSSGASLPEPAVQYREYVEWLGSETHRDRVAQDEEYWLRKLADEPAEIDLPTDRARPARKTYRSGHIRHVFTPSVSGRIRDAAQSRNSTPFHLLMASFGAWLYRVTGKSDLVIGVPMAGQAAAGLQAALRAEKLVGHCVNMLPIRLECAGQDAFADYLERTRERMYDAAEHQNVSLGKLIEKLKRPHDPSRAPLVSVSLNLARQPRTDFTGAMARPQLPPKAFSYFDLTVDVVEGAEGFVVECKYNADLFDATTVERWIVQWERLLGEAIARPEARVADLGMLSDAESQRLLVEWNATARDFPRDATLHEIIDAQMRAVPDKTALVFGDQRLTYRELDQRSTRLARYLVDRGVGADVLVGVCLERSAEMVVTFLAVLKAGGAYVPLDPTHPRDRIQYVLEDAGASVLVTQQSLLESLGNVAETMVCIDRDQAAIARMDAAPLTAKHSAQNRAYVIYTSGSTGKPKGVQIEHRAVVNFMCSMRREPGLEAGDTLLAVTTPTFDIAGLEMFLPLVCGATVVIAPQDTLMDGHGLVRLLEDQRVTVMQATPATWRLLLAAGWQGKSDLAILCGGEPLPGDLAAALLPRCKALWNVYGPTETTIWSTVSLVRDADDIHIGKPIDNTQIRIVDAFLNPVPIGVPGELLIGGDGLARGYYKRPELTAEKFIELPQSGARFYRTGDLARYRADGNIQCLGRLDFQVKVRGFRIELGEIESVLAVAPGIRQAVVVARPDASGTMALVAYVVMQDGAGLVIPELRERLRRSLPEYMVPQHFVKLAALPLTPNGKIDRKPLLAQPIVAADAPAIVEPRTPAEKLVARLFAEVLDLKRVGVDDNFFDQGGHSLMAARLMARLRVESGHDVPLRNLFDHPTVASLAQVLEAFSWTAPAQAQSQASPGREVFEV